MRSAYIDDLQPRAGQYVKCKAAIACPTFTEGRHYRVLPKGQLCDDLGNIVFPSARFTLHP